MLLTNALSTKFTCAGPYDPLHFKSIKWHYPVNIYAMKQTHVILIFQGSHRLEKYLNLEGFLEKFLKINSALKSTGKSLVSLEKSLNSTILCMT